MDWSALAISAKTSLLATVFTFFLGLYAARAVLRVNGKWRGLLDAVFTLPLVLPPTVVGFFLLMIFGKRGVIGAFLMKLGFQIVFSWPATVVAACVVAFPLMYRSARGALEQSDVNLVYAARTLGLSECTIFWKISVPLAWPGIAAGTILSFARALGEFGATLMLAGNIPGRTQTIPMAIYSYVASGDMQSAVYWVLIIVAISFAMIFLMNYWSAKQTAAGRK